MKLTTTIILLCSVMVTIYAETKCQQKAREARQWIKVIKDFFVPACRPDGSFKSMQCNWHGCYCVDTEGTANTAAVPRNKIETLPCYKPWWEM
uniref:Thyroglobulin type-1 domain-containing protein n=1 Tax=Latrodectus hesperus TaxID=256737 RepID=E7D1T3_LATHE|nr:hypothetical protein [Latrodectus hesperus]